MRILVSAGPTREYFDSIRFISNPSSGRMGYAIARAAARRGHEVTLVTGPVDLKPPAQVETIEVTSASEMARACRRAFRDADAAIMAAAVCDYRPTRRRRHKPPKTNRRHRVELEPTEDIARSLGRRKGKRLLVGFALEDHDPYAHAERKYRNKNFDLIVLNGPENVGANRARVEFYTSHSGWSEPIEGTKAAVAGRIVRQIERMRQGG